MIFNDFFYSFWSFGKKDDYEKYLYEQKKRLPGPGQYEVGKNNEYDSGPKYTYIYVIYIYSIYRIYISYEIE